MAELSQPPGRFRLRGFFRQFALWAGAHPLLCACGFFALAFALRLLCGSLVGPMVLVIYPDEIRYLHLAKSIAEGGPLLIHGLPADFQKLLYPLLISPAFLMTRDPITQLKIVEVINCLAMASVVFPTALLVKKLTAKPSVLLLTLAFVCALPDFKYTAAFMSEPLYWPLCIWVFYFFHAAMMENQPRRRLPLFALFGFLIYLCYLTKEVGAAFLIAAAAILLVKGIREKRWKQNGLALAVCLSAFFAPLLVIKQALFAGMGNSYAGSQSGWDQLGLSALKEPGAFGYMVYSAAALFVAAILSFYILPVLLPLLGRMNAEKRRMYLFTMLSLAVTAGAMAYTVSIREPWGDPVPHLHLRLLAPMAIPFVILCFDCLLSREKLRIKKRARRWIPLLTAAFGVLMLALLPCVPFEDDACHHASFFSITSLVKSLVRLGVDRATANWVLRAYLLLILALAVIGVLCFLRKRKKAVLALLLCAMFAMSAADNFVNYRAYALSKEQVDIQQSFIDATVGIQKTGNYVQSLAKLYTTDNQDHAPMMEAAVAVCDFLQGDSGTRGGIIGICMHPSYVITYASQHLRTHLFVPALVLAILAHLSSGVNELPTEEQLGGLDYLVVSENFNPFTNVEVIYEHSPYLVLRNLDPSRLCFSGEKVGFYG